jgi:hypothetical protein
MVKGQAVKKQATAQRAVVEARAVKVRRVQAILGATIVGLVALAAVIMSIMGQLPVPVTVGVVLLVVIRLYILKREITSTQ